MKDFLIAISTFNKNEALIQCIKSIIDKGMMFRADIVICDDNNGTAKDIPGVFGRSDIFYITGPNVGIAKNKNRGIKFFNDSGNYKYLILMDDDIEIAKHGLLEEFENAYLTDKAEHINMYLGSYTDPLSKKGFFTTFPVVHKTEYLYFARGCQGICCFYTKAILDRVGYFKPNWPYRYGYEHAEFSARCMKAQGTCPELFPMLHRSYKLIKTQTIPNTYEVDMDIVQSKQSAKYLEYLNDTYNGRNIYCGDPGV